MSFGEAIDRLVGHIFERRLPLRIVLGGVLVFMAYRFFGDALIAFADHSKVSGNWIFVALCVVGVALSSLIASVAAGLGAGIGSAFRSLRRGWRVQRQRRRPLQERMAAIDADERGFLTFFLKHQYERWTASDEPMATQVYRAGQRLVERGLLHCRFDLDDHTRPLFAMSQELLEALRSGAKDQYEIHPEILVPTSRVSVSGILSLP